MFRWSRSPAARLSSSRWAVARAGLSAVLPEWACSGPSTTRRTSASSGTSAGLRGAGWTLAKSPRWPDRVAAARRRRISSSTSSAVKCEAARSWARRVTDGWSEYQ